MSIFSAPPPRLPPVVVPVAGDGQAHLLPKGPWETLTALRVSLRAP